MAASWFPYARVRRDSLDADESQPLPDRAPRPRCPAPAWLLLLLSGLLNLVLAGLLVAHRGHDAALPQALYSPAQHVLRNTVTTFHVGFGKHVSVYQQPPSPAVDKAWTDLYNDFGVVKMTKSEALQLPNATYPFVNDPGYYIGELAVFHQLHCLNKLRMSLYPDYYRQVMPAAEFEADGTLGAEHLGHCVEAVREALMCAADVSVIVWQWNNVSRKAQAHGGIVHSCRDFDAVRDWAMEHRKTVEFVGDVFVQDEVTNP